VTKYRVLQYVDDVEGVTYTVVATDVGASSASSAIRASVTDDGVYVAVPESSWSVYSVRAETPKPRLVLTEA